MKWNDWNLITCGFVFGAVTAATACVMAAPPPLPTKLFLGNDGRLQWETLLTGFAALASAWFTISALRKQIRQTRELADEQRGRRARAALTVLPLALSEIEQYALSCIKGLCDLRRYFRADGALDQSQADACRSAWPFPRLPEDGLVVLKECVEFVDDAPAEAMSRLIRHLQVQKSRLRDYGSRLNLARPPEIVNIDLGLVDHAIGDAAELSARVSTIFPFSRGYLIWFIPSILITARFLGFFPMRAAISITGTLR